MHLHILLIILLGITNSLFSGNTPSKPPAQPASRSIIIPPAVDSDARYNTNPMQPLAPTTIVNLNNINNIYTSQNTETNTQQETHAHAHAAASAFSSAKAHINNFLEQHNIQFTKISPSELANATHNFWKLHKKQIIIGSCASSYIALSLALLHGNHYMNRSDLWASWKRHMSMRELQKIPQHELQQLLREAILNRYLTYTKNRLSSYLEFVKTVDQEHRFITRYLALARIIKKSRLMRLFPVNDTKIKRAQRRKKRLAFVKHIFISWAAQQNFETDKL